MVIQRRIFNILPRAAFASDVQRDAKLGRPLYR